MDDKTVFTVAERLFQHKKGHAYIPTLIRYFLEDVPQTIFEPAKKGSVHDFNEEFHVYQEAFHYIPASGLDLAHSALNRLNIPSSAHEEVFNLIKNESRLHSAMDIFLRKTGVQNGLLGKIPVPEEDPEIVNGIKNMCKGRN